jgi:hypothetical protein
MDRKNIKRLIMDRNQAKDFLLSCRLLLKERKLSVEMNRIL